MRRLLASPTGVVGNPSTTDCVAFNAKTRSVEVELDPVWALNKAKRRNFYR